LVLRHCRQVFFISPDERQPAIDIFGLAAERCAVVPYGTWLQEAPDATPARKLIRERHGFRSQDRLLLFFGPQSYPPNRSAVRFVVEKVMPQLEESETTAIHFLICGGGLSKEVLQEAAFQKATIHYLGFVAEIEPYIQAADLVLNPIDRGGGVKTKVIESIALGSPVLSFQSGALGVNQEVCGSKLQIVNDGDVEAFRAAILKCLAPSVTPTPDAFYDYHHWSRSIRPVLASW
jgi:glycosyltransferase involved in cell wall biosynthesis